jgi:hypothetical protein
MELNSSTVNECSFIPIDSEENRLIGFPNLQGFFFSVQETNVNKLSSNNIVLILYLIGVLIVKGIIGSESLKFGIIDLISKD